MPIADQFWGGSLWHVRSVWLQLGHRSRKEELTPQQIQERSQVFGAALRQEAVRHKR